MNQVFLVQIMVPCALSGHWTLYARDLEKKRIHVLDPVMCQKAREAQGSVHSGTIATLHKKLFECMCELFSGLDGNRRGYKMVFYNFVHQPALK